MIKTLILATHKPSILQLVDRVLIVVDGKIIADGPRDEVLSNFTKKLMVKANEEFFCKDINLN